VIRDQRDFDIIRKNSSGNRIIRGDAETRIKELKHDFVFDSFNINNFCGTEAALNMVMLGYNLMSLFRESILGSKVQNKLSTL
jgi:hypothetical protein